MKATKTQVIEAIRKFDGVVSEVARSLKMSPEAIRLRIKKYPELLAAQMEAREALVDKAESQLRKAVEGGAAWATKFVLETWGKSRGFTKRVEVDGKDDNTIIVHFHYTDDGRNPYHPPGYSPPAQKLPTPDDTP
jgi:hypothetical protein